MKKIISTASVATLLFAASVAIAQTGTSSPLRPLNAERRDAIRDFRDTRAEEQRDFMSDKRGMMGEVREEIWSDRDATRAALMEKRVMIKNASSTDDVRAQIASMRTMHSDFRSRVQEVRQDFHEEVRARREEMKKNLIQNREEFKKRLLDIRDTRKREIVERLDKRFEEIGDKMTDHFTKVVDRLEDVLTKVETRADKAEAAGKDVSLVRAAIDKATPLVVSARTAIAEQVSKTYPIELTDEEKLGDDVSASRKNMHTDLRAVREVIQDLRAAVVDAVAALRGIPGVDDEEPVATSTPSTSN